LTKEVDNKSHSEWNWFLWNKPRINSPKKFAILWKIKRSRVIVKIHKVFREFLELICGFSRFWAWDRDNSKPESRSKWNLKSLCKRVFLFLAERNWKQIQILWGLFAQRVSEWEHKMRTQISESHFIWKKRSSWWQKKTCTRKLRNAVKFLQST
jgi:hypothetical protein